MADKPISEKTPIQQCRFQLENVEGWLSVNDNECALIKAKCLYSATKKLIEELSKKTGKEVKYEL